MNSGDISWILASSALVLLMGWAFVVTALIMLALLYTIGVRVSQDEEAVGLDVSQHGGTPYEL